MEEKKSIATEVAKENENVNAVAKPTTEELKQQLAEAKQEIKEEKDRCSRISGYWREAEGHENDDMPKGTESAILRQANLKKS